MTEKCMNSKVWNTKCPVCKKPLGHHLPWELLACKEINQEWFKREIGV